MTVNNSSNINKTNNHLHLKSLNTKKTKTYRFGNLDPSLRQAKQNVARLNLLMEYTCSSVYRISCVYTSIRHYYVHVWFNGLLNPLKMSHIFCYIVQKWNSFKALDENAEFIELPGIKKIKYMLTQSTPKLFGEI